MYKLHLTLRYLRCRIIAYFAVLGVALCVAMMLIVVSVMNGFLDKVEQAGRGLFGDLVVWGGGLGGISHYDEFIAELKEKVPEIEAASPSITSFAILHIGRGHRQPVTISGIRLPERTRVSTFSRGLFVQHNWDNPSFDPPVRDILERLLIEQDKTKEILLREMSLTENKPLTSEQALRIDQIEFAVRHQSNAAIRLERAEPYQYRLRDLQAQLDSTRRELAGKGGQDREAVEDRIEDLVEQINELEEQSGLLAPERRIILGSALPGLTVRTKQGETVREILPGHRVDLMLVPLGKGLTLTNITPTTESFSVVDDLRTDVWSIDSEVVYLPFETLQRLNNMSAEYSAEQPGVVVNPARCAQIHIKVKPEYADDKTLPSIRDRVLDTYLNFAKRFPDTLPTVTVETWRERHAKVLGPLQQQRTLAVIMFGVISLVAVVLIFVIFYMIVHQKTRDIGVLKAVGASSAGVAGIFLIYSALVGLVGSALGTIGGYYFVKYINPIRDASEKYFGFGVWSKEWYLFEKIPNTVNWGTVVVIVIGATIASLVGALLPAMRAARMAPVEALRYE